jgi:sec-independent protein translocase protein TatA
MELFGISIWELLIILIVVLIVLGPNRLPGVARNLGKAIRTIKNASSSFTAAITKEIEAAPDKKSPAEKDTPPKNEKPSSAYPGTVGAQKKQSQPEKKPEGQPPQDEQ